MAQTPARPRLAGVPMFAGLAPEQLETVEARMRERPVTAGSEIVSQGEPGDAVFFLVEGSVKVYRRQPNGTEVILTVLGQGEVLGEMSVVEDGGGGGRWASVAALEDSRVAWMDGESFRGLLEEMPSVRSGLIELLCRRLRLADSRLETLASLDVEGRVACVLLALSEEHGRPKPGGGVRIPVPLTQGDVAAMTGASRVRVNQVLAKFRRHGWVTLDGRRRMSVRDAAALEARCR
jgi:CRP-like cAMP-binding protein